MKSFDDVFCEQFKEIIVLNKSFKDITTFKIGGRIKYLVYPRTIREIKKITKLCNKHKVKFVVLGGGSNVLASDDCFDGVVIKTTEIKEIKFCGKKVVCGCGALLGSVVISAKNKNLSGMEWAVGIPGTVGGACIMNAGAFGFETFDRLNYVVVFDGKKELHPTNIKTAVYPGFPTDLQQPFTVLLTKAKGRSKVEETIWENRFMHIAYLNKLGANITVKNRTATIDGPSELKGTEVVATDLRAGAAMVAAGLVAEGKTTIADAEHILRGYEQIVEKLKAVGAKITIKEI